MIRAARVVGGVQVFRHLLKDIISNFYVELNSQSMILNLKEAKTDNDS